MSPSSGNMFFSKTLILTLLIEQQWKTSTFNLTYEKLFETVKMSQIQLEKYKQDQNMNVWRTKRN